MCYLHVEASQAASRSNTAWVLLQGMKPYHVRCGFLKQGNMIYTSQRTETSYCAAFCVECCATRDEGASIPGSRPCSNTRSRRCVVGQCCLNTFPAAEVKQGSIERDGLYIPSWGL